MRHGVLFLDCYTGCRKTKYLYFELLYRRAKYLINLLKSILHWGAVTTYLNFGLDLVDGIGLCTNLRYSPSVKSVASMSKLASNTRVSKMHLRNNRIKY